MEFRLMTEREIEAWYYGAFGEAFAENERKPLSDILALIAGGRYELWGLFGGKTMLGYAAIWKKEGVALRLLDYLGVVAERRNGGLGADMLARIGAWGVPFVTESELPVEGDSEVENAIRRRRIAFYERNGLLPVYEMATCGSKWQALVLNAEQYALSDVMRWHKELYGPGRDDVKIPLGKNETPRLPYWMKE